MPMLISRISFQAPSPKPYAHARAVILSPVGAEKLFTVPGPFPDQPICVPPPVVQRSGKTVPHTTSPVHAITILLALLPPVSRYHHDRIWKVCPGVWHRASKFSHYHFNGA